MDTNDFEFEELETVDRLEKPEQPEPVKGKKSAQGLAIVKQLAALLILPLSLMILEIFTRQYSDIEMAPQFLGLMLGAAAFGCFFNVFACLTGKEKINRWIGFALLELGTVWFLVAYFTNTAYFVFMTPGMIFSEAGNVAGEFTDALVATIVGGIPMIVFFHIPAFLFLIFHKRVHYPAGKRIPALAALLVLTIALGLGGHLSLKGSGNQIYTAQYNYDEAVRAFGVLNSLQLDTRYNLFGNPYEAEMDLDLEDDFGEVDLFEPDFDEEEDPSMEQPGGEAWQPEEAETEYGYQVMDIDFDAVLNSDNVNSAAKKVIKYIQTLEPTRKNKYTGIFEGYNLIMITAESFSREIIDPEMTPTLYRLANQGIVFENFYQPAWGGSTSTGEYSFLMGMAPTSTGAMSATIGHNLYFTMGNQLQRLGYHTMAYHNGTTTYYQRNKTHPNFGYYDFIAMQNGMQKGVKAQFPESDLEMMEFTLPQYIDQEPFGIYYMSISGHAGYTFKANKMSAKNKDAVANMNVSEKVKAYYACNLELEYALEHMVKTLEEAGIADHTVIAICSDHYPYGLAKSDTWGNSVNYLKELYGVDEVTTTVRDRNQAILWCGAMENWDEQVVISEPSFSLDLLPTLSNLFGLEYDSRLLVGRDVLSDQEAIIFGNDLTWMTSLGFFTGREFIPNEGVEVPDGYVERIASTVKNRLAFSRVVLKYDFYGYIFGKDEIK